MAKLILTNADFNNVSRIVNLPDGVGAQEPATVAQLNAAVEGLAWKDNVAVDASTNITVASPGATINSITMVAAMRVLLRGQTAGAENGIYIWNGAATPMTRALDLNSSLEFNQAVVSVDQGPNAGTTWRQTAIAPTVGTTSIAFAAFNTGAAAATTGAAGIVRLATQGEVDAGADATITVTPATLAAYASRAKRFAQAFGDGSATSYVITHNLNSQDVHVAVYRASGAFDEVGCDVEHTSVNAITLRFASAPTSNQFRVVVIA